jgi:beta-glucosidase
MEIDSAGLQKIDALIAAMTPEEKAGQLTQYFVFGADDGAVEAEIVAGRVGAVLFVKDPSEIARLQTLAVEKSRLGVPLLFGFDVIHGLRTIFPVPIAMAASWDPPLVEQGQAVAAAEARAIGLHWTFAPMVDIARDPRWGRMIEGAGEDPHLGAAMATAQVRGFQGETLGTPGKLIAGPKHFVGYGAALGGRDYDEANLSDNELWNVYLPPFRAAINAGAGNIMCAYMALNGVPPSGNHGLLTRILRDEWQFDGFVVSDANSVFDLATHDFAKGPVDACVRALHAGLDMEMAMSIEQSAFRTLPEALKHGKVSEIALDVALRRVLIMKLRMGLFDAPYGDCMPAHATLTNPAHTTLARVAAERSFVLLRNEAATLPLDRRSIRSLAVIGPLADSARDTLGPWVFDHRVDETVTVLGGLKAKLGTHARVDYSPGVSMIPRLHASFFDALPNCDVAPRVEVDDEQEIARAVQMVLATDCTVLVLGEAQNMIGEAASRSSLDLPGRQQALLEAVLGTGKTVIVLLMSARPLDLKGALPHAIVNIWYPGSQGGNAVANLLFGDVVPGGKLPFNWVRSVGQVPLPYSRLKSHKPEDADRRYWNELGSPQYPFGYGLSYSSFEFSNLRMAAAAIEPGDTARIEVELTNTGRYRADEVAQLYLHQRFGQSARPMRLLKGFERITLDPGETRTVRFDLTASDLSYWSSAQRAWVQDETVFDIFVGSDATATLTTSFEVRCASTST